MKSGSVFHYKDPDTLSGYAQGHIISEVINTAWFEDKKAQGVVFSNMFNPIPLKTTALIFTIINHCLNKWSTSTQVKSTMWEKSLIERHKVYRMDLDKWSKLNPVAILGHRKNFSHAMRHSGAVTSSQVGMSLVGEALDRICKELDGRSGETDSEIEED